MMKQSRAITEHPERGEMLRAVRTGEVPFQTHLDECEQCRTMFELMAVSQTVGDISRTRVSSDSASSSAILPLLIGNWMPRDLVRGTSVLDTWQSNPAALRDSACGMERRLRFAAGDISLELVVERRPEGYRFVARCYKGGRASSEFVLKIGKERLSPEFRGCYFWTSNRPPRKLQLLSPSTNIECDSILW